MKTVDRRLKLISRLAGACAAAACVTSGDVVAEPTQAEVQSQVQLQVEGRLSFLDELAVLSTGSFTTIEQSAADDRYGVAEAEIVRIWPTRRDGLWLYQEQAYLGDRPDALDPGAKERPYFMRVIHSAEVSPGVVRRTVHKLKAAEAVRGAWREAVPLADVSPEDLGMSECTIIAERIARGFWRSQSEQCPNAHKDADYALSISLLTEGRYANWDRGLKRDGTHVWGPETGGYIFVRKE